MLTPNDIGKGDVVNCADGTQVKVLDSKKGIRRHCEIDGDKGSVYVFDWYARISSATETLVSSERIAMPESYLEKQARIEGDGIRTGADDLEPEPQKLGSLRDAWQGCITLYTDKSDPVVHNRSAEYPTDAHMMFLGSAINKADVKRLTRRTQDRSVSVSSAAKMWYDCVTAAETRLTVSDTVDGTQGRKVTNLHSQDMHTVIHVDSSRLCLASKVGKVDTWYGSEPLKAIVGRSRDGTATVVLMPLRAI